MTDTRFETCDHCDGSGVETFGITVYEHGCGFSHASTDERPCSKCNGRGECEFDVELITIEDLEMNSIEKDAETVRENRRWMRDWEERLEKQDREAAETYREVLKVRRERWAKLHRQPV